MQALVCRAWLSRAGFSVLLLVALPAQATFDSGQIGTHDFLIDGLDAPPHTHDAHWSWVATPPTDAPTVTTVKYAVHNGVGLHGASRVMTAAELSDVTSAATTWNTSGANVLLAPVAVGLEDIHLHMDLTSGCGVAAIGCAEVFFSGSHDALLYGDSHPQHEMSGAHELTMYDDATFGGSWFSGAAGDIAGGDRDFLTVAIQEFGHHLGLAHNDVSNGHGADIPLSPMNGTLPAGNDSRRALTLSDTTAIVHLYGASVPEPSTALLLGLGLAGVAAATRRSRRSL